MSDTNPAVAGLAQALKAAEDVTTSFTHAMVYHTAIAERVAESWLAAHDAAAKAAAWLAAADWLESFDYGGSVDWDDATASDAAKLLRTATPEEVRS